MRIADFHRLTIDDARTGRPIAQHDARCGCGLIAVASLTTVPGVVGLLLGIESSCDDHADLTPDAVAGLTDFFVESEGDITIDAALASYADRLESL